ncbi:MAG TPA: hypothetical protein VF629_04575 [Hymenobacter sp.]|jgi:hypothetical protein|uniref:hypothetical protein n=1 Tax=Hymenobacter sp. TaxID=1898978 RepID=UPI002EDA85BD
MTDSDTTNLPGTPLLPAAAPTAETRSQADFVNAWQTGLLPLMTKTLAGLALVFFLGSFVQLYYLYGRINEVPVADLQPAFHRLDSLGTAGSALTSQDLIAASRWQTLATLESLAVERR